MGDRLSEFVCLSCGDPLLDRNNTVCTQCLVKIKAKVIQRTQNPGQVKKVMLPPRK